MAKLTQQLATVELADGRVIELRLTNRARIAAELAGVKRRWPAPESSTILRTTYAIYEQLRLEELYDGSWDDFNGRDCVDFDTDQEEVDVDPTQLVQAGSYASTSRPQPESTPDGSTEPMTTS